MLCIAAGIFLVAGFYMMTLLRVDTSTGFVVLCLLVIGFSLGLMITPASNMIMNSVGKGYQGMVSSLTSLERFAPLTLGIAFANLVFIQGIDDNCQAPWDHRECTGQHQTGPDHCGF